MALSQAPKKASSLPSPCLPRALSLRSPPASARPDSWRGTDLLFLPQVLLPVANGTEPMEAVITADVLRRAGAEVAVASVEPGAATVAASWGVKLAADALIADLADAEFDLISLPVSAPALLAFSTLMFFFEGEEKTVPRLLSEIMDEATLWVRAAARHLSLLVSQMFSE
jgi:protein deglycase